MNTTTSSPLRGLIAAAIFSAVASAFTAVSAAADSTDVPQVVVKYADLNVSNPQGAAALYGRIRSAAERVCPRFERFNLASKERMDACVHKAIMDAVTTVNQPALFAEYNAKNGSSLAALPTSNTIASR